MYYVHVYVVDVDAYYVHKRYGESQRQRRRSKSGACNLCLALFKVACSLHFKVACSTAVAFVASLEGSIIKMKPAGASHGKLKKMKSLTNDT